MRAVAARVGIAATLVVHHVDSMDALVAEAFASVVAAELDEVRAFAALPEHSEAPLEAVLESLLDSTHTEVTLVWVESWVLGRVNEPLAQKVREQMEAWRHFLAELIAEGVAAGRYQVADSLAVAGQLLGMIDGVGAHSLVGWQDDENRVTLMQRAAAAMLGVAAKGSQ